MNWQLKALVAAAVIVGLALGFWLWLGIHDDRIRLQSEVAQLRAQAERDKAETERLKAEKHVVFQQARENPATMGDVIAHEVPFGIEQLPSQSPDAMAPPTIQISSPETPKFLDYVERCSVCEIELTGAKKEIANLKEQNGKLEKAGKPGFWRSLGGCVVRGGVGAAPGAIRGDGKDAGIGLGIGIASCFVWRPK